MRIKRNFRPLIVLLGSVAAFVIYYTSKAPKRGLKFIPFFESSKISFKATYETEVQTKYSVFSPYCKILNANPWDESIQKYLIRPKSLMCSQLPLLTYVEQMSNFSAILKIDKKASKLYKIQPKHSIRCYYCLISRITQHIDHYNSSADNLYVLSNCTNFEEQILLPNYTEFLIVSCLSSEKNKSPGKVVYKDVHSVISLTPEVNEKLKILEKQRGKKIDYDQPNETNLELNKPNIIILGLDSLSKLNFRRAMPKTLKYLQQNSWIEFNGYNKIGENTFPNLMAILSGQTTQTLEKICWANLSQKVDDCPALWKDFNKKGYVTLYAEDTPSISTFNLLRTGFVRKPTDYYMRPFMVAAHELMHPKILNGLPVCLGQVLIVDHIFNYAKRFFRVFNKYNYFSLLWLNSLTHNDVNIPRALDNSLHKFLNELSNIGTYNNSIILLLSDHGARFGEIRETFLGYLEERLPFLFIWCPIWFRNKYPQKYENLLNNRNRLTSPFDIHVTIKKLLTDIENKSNDAYKPISEACPKCKSLLEEQPKERSCADASIDINWCLCSGYREVNIRGKMAQRIGKYLYKSIVNYTYVLIKEEKLEKSLCSKWKFVKVLRMEEILTPNTLHQYSLRNINNTEMLRYKNQRLSPNIKFFIIIIELRPGKTKFESTVRLNLSESSENSKFAFLESPKRLDSIYLTSECVKNRLLKQFCYCVPS